MLQEAREAAFQARHVRRKKQRNALLRKARLLTAVRADTPPWAPLAPPLRPSCAPLSPHPLPRQNAVGDQGAAAIAKVRPVRPPAPATAPKAHLDAARHRG